MEERLTSEVNPGQVPFPLLIPFRTSFNGWGVTLFDSLDTMWIMGLHDLFQESLELVSKSTFAMDEVCRWLPTYNLNPYLSVLQALVRSLF
jgi:hypothetical protein